MLKIGYMRIELDKLLERLGVSYVLSPYETMPWVHYDEEKGITCSAEVRMGPTSEDIETEIQLIRDYNDDDDSDDGDDDQKSTTNNNTDGNDDGEDTKKPVMEGIPAGGQKQVMWMRADAAVANQWGPKLLRVNDKDYVNEFHDWEGKGCDFFRACIESLQMGEIPDFDEMIDDHMKDDSFYGGGRRGRIGRKSPTVKPGQLLGMKK